jgi:hypothetical protein
MVESEFLFRCYSSPMLAGSDGSANAGAATTGGGAGCAGEPSPMRVGPAAKAVVSSATLVAGAPVAVLSVVVGGAVGTGSGARAGGTVVPELSATLSGGAVGAFALAAGAGVAFVAAPIGGAAGATLRSTSTGAASGHGDRP